MHEYYFVIIIRVSITRNKNAAISVVYEREAKISLGSANRKAAVNHD